MERREYLESSLIRHGDVENLSALIEKGEKPDYETFVSYMRGEIDPPINQETTKILIQKRVGAGELNRNDFNVIVSSPSLRTQETAALIKNVTGSTAEIRITDYLREPRIPMRSITPEVYASAPDLMTVREQFMNAFLSGEKVDEDTVEVFSRARRFMEYFKKVKALTVGTPLFVTHGIFARFLRLAIDNEGEELSDEEIRNLVKKDFHKTQRPETVGGIKIASSQEGIKIVGTI